ncbi:hypothetical protein OSTOST_14612, partial [Ostertagia ostertagi]
GTTASLPEREEHDYGSTITYSTATDISTSSSTTLETVAHTATTDISSDWKTSEGVSYTATTKIPMSEWTTGESERYTTTTDISMSEYTTAESATLAKTHAKGLSTSDAAYQYTPILLAFIILIFILILI